MRITIDDWAATVTGDLLPLREPRTVMDRRSSLLALIAGLVEEFAS